MDGVFERPVRMRYSIDKQETEASLLILFMMYRLEFTLGKDFFLLKVGVRSAARTGRDVTSITSGGAILPERSLKQGSELSARASVDRAKAVIH